jgi:hypothetical protein
MRYLLNLILLCSLSAEEKYINMNLSGRLGNQMFQVAAALSLAEDFGAQAIFPDFSQSEDDRHLNYKIFFHALNTHHPEDAPSYVFQEHPHFHFTPIPFHSNMEIQGYFQSEKYFKHNKEKICAFFNPSKEIKDYLAHKYKNILKHPNTVAIHMRAYKKESSEIEKWFPFLFGDFFMKAASLFPKDALFVIFSDRIKWAKKEMKNFKRPHIFIEDEPHYHDFYLMSFCKHQILSPSSFSWWAAYLNQNPNKIVIAPDPWFTPASGHDSSNVIPEGWRTLSWQS